MSSILKKYHKNMKKTQYASEFKTEVSLIGVKGR